MNRIAIYCASAADAEQFRRMMDAYFREQSEEIDMDVYVAGGESMYYINAGTDISGLFEKIQAERTAGSIFFAEKESPEITMYRKRKKYAIPQKEIKFFKAYDGYVLGHTESGLYRMDKTLGAVLKVLEKQKFFRVSRSVVVNMAHITKYIDGELFLGSESVRVSRASKKEFEKAYARFHQNDF